MEKGRNEMNVQAHMSGQVPGHVPNQTTGQIPQRSVNSSMNTDQDLDTARKFVKAKIFDFLARRQERQMNRAQLQRFTDQVGRLEEALFKLGPSQEDYMNMNMDTLESRLVSMLKCNSSSTSSTVIPTPGDPISAINSSPDVTANATNSSQSPPVTSSNLLPNGGKL
ncbi:hypothetical protein SAY87_006902 [Trapa incisa]|uniref:Uncharacterized protein n=1 Tax=Trapa incisa TaxID=236973 RepID=A0AAN7K3F6_9MYRT|nr:hypothetical protein SAY87_006900 [Trapa incisa]KAK4756775.1 hypothetical protein SAY87_006902 [Trapa incisa]